MLEQARAHYSAHFSLLNVAHGQVMSNNSLPSCPSPSLPSLALPCPYLISRPGRIWERSPPWDGGEKQPHPGPYEEQS